MTSWRKKTLGRVWAGAPVLFAGMLCAGGALKAQGAAQAQPSAAPQQSERAQALGDRIMCMCGGCNDAAAQCKHSGGAFAGPCQTASMMLKEVNERVGRNEPEDLTVQAFIQEYGPTVMIVPVARGFNLWVWIMPVVFALAGLGLVRLLLLRWRRRSAAAQEEKVSAELLARARREVGEEGEA